MKPNEADIIIANTLSTWSKGTRENVSVDAGAYSLLFFFIPVVHTIHDQSGTPCLLLLNRKQALSMASTHYGIKHGKSEWLTTT